MQLTSMGQLAIDNFEDLSFLMRDGDNVVRIDVQRSLLKDLSRSRSRPLAATFDEHRNRIDPVAFTADRLAEFEDHLLVFFTGIKRKAEELAARQVRQGRAEPCPTCHDACDGR